MKRIEYLYNIPINLGDEENPVWEDNLYQKSLPYSAESEKIAQREAYDGKSTVEDDGLPEPVPAGEPVTWDELDAAYTAGYEEGYTEGVNGAYGNE